jgi:hypothetical protein
MNHHHPQVIAADVAAVGIAGAAWMQWLPAIAAAISIVWFLIQIWESKTVQEWARKRHEKRHRVPCSHCGR